MYTVCYSVSHSVSCVGQASLQSELLKSGGQQTGFVSLCREILTRFIEDRFPTSVEGLVSGDGALVICSCRCWHPLMRLLFKVCGVACVCQGVLCGNVDTALDRPIFSQC